MQPQLSQDSVCRWGWSRNPRALPTDTSKERDLNVCTIMQFYSFKSFLSDNCHTNDNFELHIMCSQFILLCLDANLPLSISILLKNTFLLKKRERISFYIYFIHKSVLSTWMYVYHLYTIVLRGQRKISETLKWLKGGCWPLYWCWRSKPGSSPMAKVVGR